jgi:hypothetical protein
MKIYLCIFAGILLFLPIYAENKKDDSKINLDIKKYSFGLLYQKEKQGGFFRFEMPGNAYSLYVISSKQEICKNVYYVKTFGGLPPTVTIYLINKRYVVYPETIRNSDIKPAPLEHDMLALTHIYDLKSKRIIYTTPPYQYGHNIPAMINLNMIYIMINGIKIDGPENL